MSTTVAVGCGLGAAALFAAGTALQYGAATSAAGHPSLEWRSVAGFARRNLTSRRWIVGTLLLGAGLGLHAVALHEGPLTLVQPILILGVLFALPLSQMVGGPPVRAADLRWAAVLVGALVVFLVTATPAGQSRHGIDSGPAELSFVLGALGVAACVVVARRRPADQTALLLGAAAGIALAGSAALIKVTSDVVHAGIFHLLFAWELWALLAVGALALLLSQLAYRAGPMVTSIPAINTANPLVSVAVGTFVFDERFRTGAAATLIEFVALAVVLVATAALSRRSVSLPAEP